MPLANPSDMRDHSDQAPGPADIRRAAMDLLARREHSRLELRQKLGKRFRDDVLIEEQLARLAEENLQSDARYAESFLRQRYQRGHGPVRIRQEMRHRGIPERDIQAAMESGDWDWYTSAATVLERKFGSAPADDRKEKARRDRFMRYRGFMGEHYQHLIDR